MRKLIIAVILLIGVIVLLALFSRVVSKGQTTLPTTSPTPLLNSNTSTQSPKIISTKPDPLEESIISATEVVEITFNRPLENVGEFKVRLEPKIDYKVELSDDRKTAKIVPVKPYQLGTTYTLFIGTETKFDGVGRWGEEKVFHFKTITYRGV